MMLDSENFVSALKWLLPFAAITPETIEANMRMCDSSVQIH
jgi:hypothetical protein